MIVIFYEEVLKAQMHLTISALYECLILAHELVAVFVFKIKRISFKFRNFPTRTSVYSDAYQAYFSIGVKSSDCICAGNDWNNFFVTFYVTIETKILAFSGFPT